MRKPTRITIDGRSYGPGDTIEITRDGQTVRSVVPDLEARSEELTDEQLDAVSGGWPGCHEVCDNLAQWMAVHMCFDGGGSMACYCTSLAGGPIDSLTFCPTLR